MAIAVILSLFFVARLPELAPGERVALAAQFAFARLPLAEVPGIPHRSVRSVHPSLRHVSAYMSILGASIALNDLDGDGLPNDVCYVDARTDQVVVAPVPGTPARFQPFTLDPAPLPFDPATMAAHGCLLGDLNEDGLLDILVFYFGRTPVAFLRRAGGESRLEASRYVPRELISGGGRWYTAAASMADLDGDGHHDLIIANYFPDGSRILDAEATGFEPMYSSWGRAYNGGSKRLLLWKEATGGAEPSVRFEDVRGILDEEVNRAWTIAIGACDLDGDLLPEIYFANDFGPDRLLHNRSTPGHLRFVRLEGKPSLVTPASKVLGRDGFHGMGVDCADVNGDGLPDMLVTNITVPYGGHESNLMWMSTGDVRAMSRGIAPYVDRSEAMGLARSGWSWDAKLGDFNNDGVPEAILATGFIKGTVNRWPEMQEMVMSNEALLHDTRFWPDLREGDDVSGHEHSPFFVRHVDGRYYDIARELGLHDLHLARGIATADVDGDGRLDYAMAIQFGPSYFFRNDSRNVGAFLGLHLLLPSSADAGVGTRARAGHPGPDTPGRPAIGAEITVHRPNGTRMVAWVDGGNGAFGRRSADVHFGLGHTAPKRLRVDMRWRDSRGRVVQDTLELSPGWHTVVLRGQREG